MEKMKYQISSRATILLGRESVSKVEGAIIELVKNTYDADASFCYILFDMQKDKIYILDNGIGMTKHIIQTCWMMIGTDNKRDEYISVKNRVKSGEKGIGRFALDRLGSKCKMYTKNENEPLIYWFNDWSNFEQRGKTIDEIEADFMYMEKKFIDILPQTIILNIDELKMKALNQIHIENNDLVQYAENINSINEFFRLKTGTLFEISGLRDNWSENDILKVINVLGYLLPPKEQKDYGIFVQKNCDNKAIDIDNTIHDEFDYKVRAFFDGTKVNAKVIRNEFDTNLMPKELFDNEAFKNHPFRLEDFIKQEFSISTPIEELLLNTNDKFIEIAKEIGPFEFEYVFMKLSTREDGPYFYRPISPKRKYWLENHGGIKIYRDNFLVRPYGDPMSNAFDWLGLDSRKSLNPVAISHKSGQWHVNNSQIQGTVLISRVYNSSILDKSSREGIIENDHFILFSNILKGIINIFEKDRAYIVRNIKSYLDEKNEKQKTKEEAKKLARDILKKGKNKGDSTNDDASKLAVAVQYFQEERDELISEIKLLRALATNGLITTSMVHDLKSINALLVSRVKGMRIAINLNDKDLINRNLEDLKLNDEFMKSWITVITSQSNKDRRRRLKKDMYYTINQSIRMLNPILERKKVNIEFFTDKKEAKRRIFESDFDSIIYNLIINSIEAFEETTCKNRIIKIEIESNENTFIIHYIDNGHGLDKAFWSNPYKIFDYGISNKCDAEGNQIGTGLGMYIVASSISEYRGKYIITKYQDGFGIDIEIPIE